MKAQAGGWKDARARHALGHGRGSGASAAYGGPWMPRGTPKAWETPSKSTKHGKNPDEMVLLFSWGFPEHHRYVESTPRVWYDDGHPFGGRRPCDQTVCFSAQSVLHYKTRLEPEK